jgi:hypothetical protein
MGENARCCSALVPSAWRAWAMAPGQSGPRRLPRAKKATDVMTSVDLAAAQVAMERLLALADDLGQRGFATHALRTDSGVCLRVRHRTVSRLSEDVYVARAHDERWWFWWSWAEPIAEVDDVAATAARVAHVLTTSHD